MVPQGGRKKISRAEAGRQAVAGPHVPQHLARTRNGRAWPGRDIGLS